MTVKCPRCGRKSKPLPGGLYQCVLHGLHDADPDEGGSYSDRNVAARLEREDRRRENLNRRLSNGNRNRS